MKKRIEIKSNDKVGSMRDEMHKALDLRIKNLKEKGFDLNNSEGWNLLSEVETEGKFLKISLMIPIESVSLEELNKFMKDHNK